MKKREKDRDRGTEGERGVRGVRDERERERREREERERRAQSTLAIRDRCLCSNKLGYLFTR